MMPRNTIKHAHTKGRERPPLPVIAIDNIAVWIPIHLLGNREESNGLQVAKANTDWSGSNYDDIPAPKSNSALALPNDGDDSKRKASIHMHTGNESTPKRAKKQDRPSLNYTKENPSNDEDLKPTAKKNTPSPQDGAPNTFPGFKRNSTSTRTGYVVPASRQIIKREHTPKTETDSNSKCESISGRRSTIEDAANDVKPVVSKTGQGIKREPASKTETASNSKCEPMTGQMGESLDENPTDQAEASIPTETVREVPNMNRAFTVRRKAAKRTEPLYIAPSPQNIAAPLLPSPQAEEIPARKQPRLEKPPPTTFAEATTKTPSPDISVGFPPLPADNDNDDSNAESVTYTQPNARATARWTSEEDAKMISAVTNTRKTKWGVIDWVAVAVLVPGRTRRQCCNRWNSISTSTIDSTTACTGKWGEDEVIKLNSAVEMYRGKKWDEIAVLVPGRTRIQCWNRWHNSLDPNNRRTGEWTVNEDSKLTSAVHAHGGKKWEATAALVPGRTLTQCYNRWHDFLDPSSGTASGRTGKWTEDEVSKLKGAVQTQGDTNWVAVAAMVPGRTRTQCCNRWHISLKPSSDTVSRRTGKWTEGEDNMLKDAVKTLGEKDWAAVAALIPGRSKDQCRIRWNYRSISTIDQTTAYAGTWTEDEDRKLECAVQTHGVKNWVAVAALVPDRTNTQCRNRWKITQGP